jgi:hypothetical protein
MAGNTLSGLFQTVVVPATAQIAQPLAYRNGAVKKITTVKQPLSGTVGQTVNINIPVVSENDVIDIGNGPIQVTDGDHASVSLTINNNKSWSRRIPDFDQCRTPVLFKELYLAPGIESVLRKINRQVCNLITATNFASYTSITGPAAVFSRLNVAAAWANLVASGVPMTPGDVHLLVHHQPYSTMIGDDTYKWIQQNIVGDTAAAQVQQTARLMPAFGADIDYDQQMPTPTGSTYSGLFFNKNAIAIAPVTPADQISKPHVEEMLFTPPGTDLIFRIQMWYSPDGQGLIIHIHAIFALAIVRPNFGSYLVTT